MRSTLSVALALLVAVLWVALASGCGSDVITVGTVSTSADAAGPDDSSYGGMDAPVDATDDSKRPRDASHD